MKKILVKRKIMTFEEMKKAFPDAEEIITLDSLLKDKCKLAKELWGVKMICDLCFKSIFNRCCGANFMPAYQARLHDILDEVISGNNIQEYIDKTKI